MFTLCDPWITFGLFEASISVVPVISSSIFLSSLNNVARKIISMLPSAVEELRLCSSKRSLSQTWYDSRSMAIQLEQLGALQTTGPHPSTVLSLSFLLPQNKRPILQVSSLKMFRKHLRGKLEDNRA